MEKTNATQNRIHFWKNQDGVQTTETTSTEQKLDLTAVINNMALLLNSACYADWGGKWFATAIFSHGKSRGIKKHGSQHADIPHAVTCM